MELGRVIAHYAKAARTTMPPSLLAPGSGSCQRWKGLRILVQTGHSGGLAITESRPWALPSPFEERPPAKSIVKS